MHRLQERRAVASLSKESPPAGIRRRRVALIAAVAATVVAIDQITKSLAVADLAHRSVHLVGPFYLALDYNSGIAFSIGTGLTWPIILIAAALVLTVAWFARGVVTTTGAIAFGLILGGATGNLADRLFRGHHGAVVDFFYSGFWPTFNAGDASIVVGSALLAATYWRAGNARHKQAEEPS